MRGEDVIRTESGNSLPGSPPHAWGRRLRRTQTCTPCRFTPTCVGKTVAPNPNVYTVPVHPHMRGEDYYGSDPAVEANGSPPHAWGRHFDIARITDVVRFTPTCVGKTQRLFRTGRANTVHPHMRGEDILVVIHCLISFGSPPHAWGRLTGGISNSSS